MVSAELILLRCLQWLQRLACLTLRKTRRCCLLEVSNGFSSTCRPVCSSENKVRCFLIPWSQVSGNSQ